MANTSRNFVLGRMNKSLDERLVPNGEYLNALNIRVGSTEESEVGVVENTKGNLKVTPNIEYNGETVSGNAKCIGAYADDANETIYWFINWPGYTAATALDLVLSYNTKGQIMTYHLISVNDGTGTKTTLNFNQEHLITGVDLVDGKYLFWTDDINPPRFIDVKKSYGNPDSNTQIDGFSAEDILVAKKPPVTSPTAVATITSSQNNFLQDRFTCFGYRYKYDGDMYSATSQFSSPAFIPGIFDYDFATGLNEGMLNAANTAVITYNSGGPLVKTVDLLWKDMQTGSIRVIEKLNKEELGLVDNTNYTYTFSNSKIYTVLPESEILRLYDNVPRLAKSQTVMGNRLVYGNYLEQYDIISLSGFPTRLEYTLSLNSEEIGVENITDTLSNGNYSWDGAFTATNAVVNFDFDGIDLKAESIIDIVLRFEHFGFSGDTTPTEQTAETEINFQYVLPQDFASPYDLATSADFQEKIGTLSNIQTVSSACTGTTLTDEFNCAVTSTLSGLQKYESGINGPGEPMTIISTPSSTVIGFQLPAIRYVDDPTGVSITQNAYEYYSVTIAEGTYQSIGNPKSLHSNRSYEVGIIYMDDFNRATTALVSENNTVHVPCSLSSSKNNIRVEIPTQQLAPFWATRYKLCIKSDKEGFFTVYSSFFFRDPTTGADYFLLEGQNTRKVEEGDILTVKTDSSGPLNRCVNATVLEKKAQEKNFLDPPPTDASGNNLVVPAGTYMKIRANDFATELGDLPVVDYGTKNEDGKGCMEIYYPVDREDPASAGSYIDYTIPAGSRINILIDNERRGRGSTPKRSWYVNAKFTASREYNNFKDWFDGDNIAAALEAQAVKDGVNGPNYDVVNGNLSAKPCNCCNIYTRFNTFNNRTWFGVKSSEGVANTTNKKVRLKVKIEVIRSTSLVIFETKAQDSAPDIWYESPVSYAIDPTSGTHEGNVQNQTGSQSAIIDTEFYNCYAFGNGVESYQIRDSVDGKELKLGNRVTTTSAQDYKEMRRFADLTYSGVYNDESNVNKLNEFNLGLLNFKSLEDSYGPIFKLDSRATDILVLQEDKISYVLAGKNLLTDSTGGSVVASVPEVLGTQVARTEDYGISRNPESYVRWGYDKYFTDGKRGAVIQLKGASGQSEKLNVISEAGMRSWFRDLFINKLDTQKLGGFDPYSNEYVLTSNDNPLPDDTPCIECGITRTVYALGNGFPGTEFCVNVGYLIGEVEIYWSASADARIDATFNGTTVSSTNMLAPLLVDKNVLTEQIVDIVVTATTVDSVEAHITVNCPAAQEITIVQVCLSNDTDSGQFIHNEYRWVDGSFVSPLHSSAVTLQSGTTSPLVSQYDVITGPQGSGFIPADGATVSIISNKIGPVDDFVFAPSVDELRYLRSSTLYANNSTDIAALLAASQNATPITGGPNTYEAAFTMPSSSDQYLYLIYNYRNSSSVQLCHSTVGVGDVCCSCEGSNNLRVEECQHDSSATPIYQIVPELGGVGVGDFVELTIAGCVGQVISTTEEPSTDTISVVRSDVTNCNDVCLMYRFTNTGLNPKDVRFYTCVGGEEQTITLAPDANTTVCVKQITFLPGVVTANRLTCDCGDVWLVRQCRLDGVTNDQYVNGNGLLSGGEFVSLTDDTDCRYEVKYRVAETATRTLNSVETETSCAEVCQEYVATNTDASLSRTVSYVDCSGTAQTSGDISPGGTFTFCAKEITPPHATVSLELNSCGCTLP